MTGVGLPRRSPKTGCTGWAKPTMWKSWTIYAEDTIDQRILACLERKENLAERFRSELKRRNGVLWLHGRETEDYK